MPALLDGRDSVGTEQRQPEAVDTEVAVETI
jgi:hypothetical protein